MRSDKDRIICSLSQIRRRELNPETAAELEALFKAAWEKLLASEQKPATEFSPEENRRAIAPKTRKRTDTRDHKQRRKKPD
jgi:hypothetical protein